MLKLGKNFTKNVIHQYLPLDLSFFIKKFDTAICPFKTRVYTSFIKFGIGRATYDAAQEIRNQKITREEGISLVHKYDHEFPDQFLNDFLDYFEVNFFEIIYL